MNYKDISLVARKQSYQAMHVEDTTTSVQFELWQIQFDAQRFVIDSENVHGRAGGRGNNVRCLCHGTVPTYSVHMASPSSVTCHNSPLAPSTCPSPITKSRDTPNPSSNASSTASLYNNHVFNFNPATSNFPLPPHSTLTTPTIQSTSTNHHVSPHPRHHTRQSNYSPSSPSA
ncbi:hypothetical protein J1614_006394 [Plenodomus biglobosus]|nr:hypothetical protein J1614_006394 [Plenodomus biglobosus]